MRFKLVRDYKSCTNHILSSFIWSFYPRQKHLFPFIVALITRISSNDVFEKQNERNERQRRIIIIKTKIAFDYNNNCVTSTLQNFGQQRPPPQLCVVLILHFLRLLLPFILFHLSCCVCTFHNAPRLHVIWKFLNK